MAQQLYEMITNLFCPQVASKMGFGDARKTFEKVRIQSPLRALRQTAGFPCTFSTHIKLCRAGQALQSAPPPPGSLPPGHPGPAAEPRAGRRAAWNLLGSELSTRPQTCSRSSLLRPNSRMPFWVSSPSTSWPSQTSHS